MAGSMRLKTGRGFNSKFAGEAMTEAIVKSIREWAPEVTEQFDKFVADWSDESRPEFIATPRKLQNNRGVSFGVRAKGTDIQKARWRMIDVKGRKKGKQITANRPGNLTTIQGKYGPYKAIRYLRFQEFYYAKTEPVAQYGQAQGGTRGGPWISKYSVTQGAIEPRHFSREYLPRFKKGFLKASRNGYRRAFNKITTGQQI